MRRGHDRLTVGVVGATGLVGRELIGLLDRRRFPVAHLLAFSSGRDRSSSARFRGRALAAPGPDLDTMKACDLVFLVSSDEVALRHGRRLAARGCWVIDDSAAFRLDPRVPLVIPEVNPEALRRTKRLIAGPNCTMTGIGVAGALLHRAVGVRQVRLASYQAVSGAGKAALAELFAQARSPSGAGDRAPSPPGGPAPILPRAIAFNVVPQVGRFLASGDSTEEIKVSAELKKVWAAPRLQVSATTVRVPTVRGHALAAWLTLAAPISLARARSLLARTPGLRLCLGASYPTPRSAGGREPVFVGRVRRGATPRELCLWIVSDNLLKGAALNSVQIAEELLRRGWL